MRERYMQQLEQLNREMTEMGDLCEEAIRGAAKCLTGGGEAGIQEAIAAEVQIDHKERDIESLCMKMMLLQQPVASDLRTISSALKMISDMERIGDQAADIAELVKYVRGQKEAPCVPHIADMVNAACRMVDASVDSFVQRDLKAAQEVISYDDVVDELFLMVKRELTGMICRNPTRAELCMDFLMIAKYLERIGDHATNIAEWVEYSITGVHRND